MIQLIAQGNEAAFTELFYRYRNKIYSIAFDLTDSESIAEEIVQDVFLKIWLRRASLPGVEHFTAYLFTITRNEVFTVLKKIARKQLIENAASEINPLFYIDTEERISEKEYRAILLQALEKLSVQQRQVYHLIKEEGLTREQAALKLGISQETVKTHLAQAMRNIRAYCLARIDKKNIFSASPAKLLTIVSLMELAAALH